MKSTPDRYGTVALALHWLSAALMLGLVAAGFAAANTTDAVAKAAILRLHVPIGLLVLVLTLARLVWWLVFDRKPTEVAGLPPMQRLAAKTVHGLLYVAVLGLAGSGIALMALSGAGGILFGEGGALPDFWAYPPRWGHAVLARLLVVMLVLHIGAALYHQFVRRDRLFARMGIGR